MKKPHMNSESNIEIDRVEKAVNTLTRQTPLV